MNTPDHAISPRLASRHIKPLSTQLANQIAAGEVVERPASVAKELVENSIDAGATQIEVVIERGGSALIEVADNGCGVMAEDLHYVLAPHATSKVYNQQELIHVTSLGFRGEALASISSVAKVEVQARTADSPVGWGIKGSRSEPMPVAMPPGCRVSVRELFFNTPARKRFLRTERTEMLQIEEMVRALALSHFEVGFLLRHNGRQLWKLPIADSDDLRLARIAQLYGRAFVNGARRISFLHQGMELSGWLSTAARAGQSDFYLNGRMMRDKVLRHAVRQAYQQVVGEGVQPAYLLNLSIAPDQVDINVHPTKHEVRFRQGRVVHDFLISTLKQALQQQVPSDEGAAATLLDQGLNRNAAPSPNQAVAAINDQAPVYQRSAAGGHGGPARGTINHSIAGPRPFGAPRPHAVTTTRPVVTPAAAPLPLPIEWRATLQQRYLLLEQDGVYGLTDLLTLLRHQLTTHALAQLPSRPLLFPLTCDVAPWVIERLNGHWEGLAELGFVCDPQGVEHVVLRALPLFLRGMDGQGLLAAICNGLEPTDEEELATQVTTILLDYLQQHGMAVSAEELPRLLQGIGVEGMAALWGHHATVTLTPARLASLFL